MELSKKQKQIVESTEDKIVVIAAAASGKSRCLVERIRYLLNNGMPANQIVAITFTNNAAEVMRERLGDDGKDCFIGTVHAYANYILSVAGYDTRKYLDKEQFDELFEMVKRHPDCIRPIGYLLWDETQDSTSQQFEFLLEMAKPKQFFLVGDLRQSIYSFLDADPDYLYNLTTKEEVTVYNLNENYRNAPQILSYAKDFLEPLGYKYYDDSIPMSKAYGQVYRIEFAPSKIGRFILENDESDYRDWFVLARTNQQVADIYTSLTAMGIPCDTFKKADLSNAELNKKMDENTVKVLTMHASKGLETKNVVVAGAQYYNDEERRLNYVAATRARELLVWCTMPKKNKKKEQMKTMSWD